MDAANIATLASVIVAFGGGVTAITKIVIDRHLSALTRLEERAAQTAEAQQRTALAFDVMILHLQNLLTGQGRIERNVQRVVDYHGLPGHEDTEPAPAPPLEPIPRSDAIIGRAMAPSRPV